MFLIETDTMTIEKEEDHNKLITCAINYLKNLPKSLIYKKFQYNL